MGVRAKRGPPVLTSADWSAAESDRRRMRLVQTAAVVEKALVLVSDRSSLIEEDVEVRLQVRDSLLSDRSSLIEEDVPG